MLYVGLIAWTVGQAYVSVRSVYTRQTDRRTDRQTDRDSAVIVILRVDGV